MRKSTVLAAGGVTVFAATLLVAPPASAAVEPPAQPIVRTVPAIEMPTQYPSQPDLRVFDDNPADASINRGVIPYDEIAPFLNEVMDDSDRVSAQVVGQSSQGRDIYLVTVTAPETPEEVAQQAEWRHAVKYEPEAAAEDEALQEGYKVPLWFNGNIHGNEWEGTDATLNYIADLAESTDPTVEAMLEQHRIYFTVVNNPDGRALGQRATATGYDPNRDFITNATVETAIIRDLTAAIQPTYFIDLHGYTNVLQVEPCGPPHGENYEYDLFLPHAYATALDIEERVTAANIPGNTYLDRTTNQVVSNNTGNIRIPYRDIRAGWDDWPPIFAPQYVAYQGAITNTVELPLGRVNPATDPRNPERAAVNIEVAEIVIDATADYVAEHSDALLSNQIEIFRRGLAGEASVEIPADIAADDLPADVPTEWTEIWDETDVYTAEYPRAYVIPQGDAQRSESDARTLVQQLMVHGIQVDRLTAPLTVAGETYPAGSYYVDMHQPLRGLANVLLDEGTDISDRVPDMYDISAWSLALLWGADVVSIGDTSDAAPTTALEDVTSAAFEGSVTGSGDYLTFEPAGVADWQAVNELLGEGIALSQLLDGRIIFARSATADAAASQIAELYGVKLTADDGVALRAGDGVGLTALTVGYTGSSDDRDVLAKLGFRDTVAVSETTLLDGIASLADVDVLFVASALTFPVSNNGWTAEQSAAGRAIIQAYLDAGKPVVGRGTAGATFATSYGLATLATQSAPGGSNGIVSVVTAPDGVLGDYPQDTAFVSPAIAFTGFDADVAVERTYAADAFISGHWTATAALTQQNAPGMASEVSTITDDGNRVFLFGTSPTYRNHPVGAFSDVARALFWSAAADSAVTVPPVTTPEPTPTPTEPAPIEEPAPTPTETAAPAAGALASTGTPGTAPLWAGAFALMLLGGGVFVIARTRSRRSEV